MSNSVGSNPRPPAGERLASAIGNFALANPIVCGSGEHVMTIAGIRAALAAGVAGVVAKSTNESAAAARQLDRAGYAMLRSDGTVASWPRGPASAPAGEHSLFCRSGLVDVLPPESWLTLLATLDAEAARAGQFVAVSIVLADSGAAVDLARFAGEQGIRVLELNIGAPHGTEAQPGTITIETDPVRVARTVERVRAAFNGVLWIKLTGLSDNIVALARAARESQADAVVLTGRSMGFVPDLDTLEPVLGTCAAYGGRWALPMTCRWLALARRELGKDYPLVGTNGARTGLDVARLLLAGAAAVEMTSVVFHNGFGALAQARAELEDWLVAKNLTVSGIVGRAADALASYADQPARKGHWREFVPEAGSP